MKLLRIGTSSLDTGGVIRLAVCEASILTGYFNRSMQPMLCIDAEKRIVPPSERLDQRNAKVEKFSIGDQWVYAGVIEGSDDELRVLTDEGGYQLRDLRSTSIRELLLNGVVPDQHGS